MSKKEFNLCLDKIKDPRTWTNTIKLLSDKNTLIYYVLYGRFPELRNIYHDANINKGFSTYILVTNEKCEWSIETILHPSNTYETGLISIEHVDIGYFEHPKFLYDVKIKKEKMKYMYDRCKIQKMFPLILFGMKDSNSPLKILNKDVIFYIYCILMI